MRTIKNDPKKVLLALIDGCKVKIGINLYDLSGALCNLSVYDWNGAVEVQE